MTLAVSNSEFLRLRRAPSGRRLFALTQMRERVDPCREPGLLERIDAALAWNREVLNIEYRWAALKGLQSKARGKAFEIDNQLDRSLSSLNLVLQGFVSGPENSPKTKKADRILKEIFPRGVSAVTQLNFEQQNATTDMIVQKLETTLASDLVELGLVEYLMKINELNEALRAELAKYPEGPKWRDVSAARIKGQDLYAGVILWVLAHYSDHDEEELARREELLEEVKRQDRLLVSYYRRARGTVDVDPETGVELDPQDELSEVESDPELMLESSADTESITV